MNDAARVTPPATAAVVVVLATAVAAVGAAHYGSWAGAQDEPPSVALLYAGAVVEPPLVELHASPEPATLELVASGLDGEAEVSIRVVRSSHWGAAVTPATPTLVNHGGGEATLYVDRSLPGELVIDVVSDEARSLYVVRVLDALPPPGGHDMAAPSSIVGGVDPADPAMPRILAQARLPFCAGTPHAADAAILLGIRDSLGSHAERLPLALGYTSWETHLAMSGVPPIEGVSPNHSARAVFGQQVPQWIHLDKIGDPNRERYYLKAREDPGVDYPAMTVEVKNPYTNKTENWGYTRTPRAAAPGPYWGGEKPDGGHGVVNLHLVVNGTERHVTASVTGTNSFVPEILPLNGTVSTLATAFHGDVATFSVMGPPSRTAAHMPLEPPPGATHALVNGTMVPLDSRLSATVRVSEIARQNGILIEGITDGEGTKGMEVKKLHEITLVAELPIDVGYIGAYGLVEPELSVAPWECWPRLYHPAACLEEPQEWCPSGSSGAAWVP